MVDTGKQLDNWQQNKAVATYITFQERFNQAPLLKYTSVVEASDREYVDKLYRQVKDTENFGDAIDTAIETQTTQAWDQFKKVMYVESENILKEKGVQFQPSPSKDTHADFLKVNHDISDESAKWLFPGSVMLYLAQQLQDENSTSSNTTK